MHSKPVTATHSVACWWCFRTHTRNPHRLLAEQRNSSHISSLARMVHQGLGARMPELLCPAQHVQHHSMCLLKHCTQPLARPPVKHLQEHQPQLAHTGCYSDKGMPEDTLCTETNTHSANHPSLVHEHSQPHHRVLTHSGSWHANQRAISFHRHSTDRNTYEAHDPHTHRDTQDRTHAPQNPKLKPQNQTSAQTPTVTNARCCHKPQNTRRATNAAPGLQRLPGRCVYVDTWCCSTRPSLLQKHRQPGLEITQRLWPVHSAQIHAEGMCCVDTAAIHTLQWQLQSLLLPTPCQMRH